jgi:hypothetical protein
MLALPPYHRLHTYTYLPQAAYLHILTTGSIPIHTYHRLHTYTYLPQAPYLYLPQAAEEKKAMEDSGGGAGIGMYRHRHVLEYM